MKMIKSELFLCMALTAFVFVCALAWGSPFLVARSTLASIHSQQQTQASVFVGSVLRDGGQFLLRDSAGRTFRLDDARHAQPFEGKTVTITGTLDAQSQMIHIVRIQSSVA